MTRQRVDQDRAEAHIRAVIAAVEAAVEEVEAVFGDGMEIPEAFSAPDAMRELWRVANGMQCGDVHIYSSLDASERGMGYAEMLAEGQDRWQGIAEIALAPVFMDRSDGTIWFNWGSSWHELIELRDELPMQQIAPDIWTFTVCYGMGSSYPDFLDPSWTAFLDEHGLFYTEAEESE